MVGSGHGGTRMPTILEIEERRTKTIALFERGYSTREIARALGVGHSTVDRDIQAMLARFWAEQVGSLDRVRASVLAQMARRHQLTMEIVTDRTQPAAVRLKAVGTAQGIAMNVLHVLGALPSQKVELSGPEGEPIEIHQLLRVIPPSVMDDLVAARGTEEVVAVIERAAKVVPELVPLARQLGAIDSSRPLVGELLHDDENSRRPPC